MLASTFAGLYVLAVLACPVGMGLMMWFMGKGMRSGSKAGTVDEPHRSGRQSLAGLKAEQARLAEKISTLEHREVEEQRNAVADGERTPA